MSAVREVSGAEPAVGKKKPDFVGKRSLSRPEMARADRRQLVGLTTQDRETVLEEGTQVMVAPGVPGRSLGHVTSSYHSAVLGRSIALGLIAGGRARMGQTLSVALETGPVPVQVTSPVFYDPEGKRLHA